MLYAGLNVLVVFVLFPSGLLRVFSAPTHGLISSTLVANVFILVILIGFLRWATQLMLEDLGMQGAGLGAGVVVMLVLWLGVNAFEAACAWLARSPVAIASEWRTAGGAMSSTGALVGQILGNATLEDVLFRGVLFQQTRMHLLARDQGNPTKALALALLISQAIFAAIHIPLRVSSGMALAALPAELALLFTLGVLLALLYWRTGNLYVVIGVHALSNAPTLVVRQQLDLSTNGLIAAVGSLLIMMLWPGPRCHSAS